MDQRLLPHAGSSGQMPRTVARGARTPRCGRGYELAFFICEGEMGGSVFGITSASSAAERLAPARFAPERLALEKLEPVRSAPVKSAPLRSAPVKSEPTSFELLSFASFIFAPVRLARIITDLLRSALCRKTSVRLALRRATPLIPWPLSMRFLTRSLIFSEEVRSATERSVRR